MIKYWIIISLWDQCRPYRPSHLCRLIKICTVGYYLGSYFTVTTSRNMNINKDEEVHLGSLACYGLMIFKLCVLNSFNIKECFLPLWSVNLSDIIIMWAHYWFCKQCRQESKVDACNWRFIVMNLFQVSLLLCITYNTFKNIGQLQYTQDNVTVIKLIYNCILMHIG